MADTAGKSAIKLSLPLPYQQEIFLEVRKRDGLLILARGLGLLRIVANLLHSYDMAGNNLILVIGADDRENGWIGETMAEHATLNCAAQAAAAGEATGIASSTNTTNDPEIPHHQPHAPKGLIIVNTDVTNVKSRAKMYARGGIFSITSRILIVDYLSGLLDPAKVTGMVVLHAERVTETSLEAFILRIYRQKNTSGFLKAFSDSPEPFTLGFSPLNKILNNLHLKSAFLFPRFQVTVAESLEGKKRAEVIELEVEMTEAMQTIQIAIMECIEVSISELKKANPGLDVEGWDLDAALHKNFDVMVRRQLEPVWHRTSFRTRQMVRDLTLLRGMLSALLSYDCVTFNKYLDTIRAAAAPPPGSTRFNHPPWILLDAAETIFSLAKGRVYTGHLFPDIPLEKQPNFFPILEEQPKWALLAEIMDEIDQHLLTTQAGGIPNRSNSGNNKTVLIMCVEPGTCWQIREYLQTMNIQSQFLHDDQSDGMDTNATDQSGHLLLDRKLRNYVAWKRDFGKFSASMLSDNTKIHQQQHNQGQGTMGRPPPAKRRRVRGGSSVAGAPGSGRNSPMPGNGHSSASFHIPGDKEAHMSRIMADLRQGEIDQAVNAVLLDDSVTTTAGYYAGAGAGWSSYHEFENHFELFDMDDLVLVHPYDGDMDEHLLEETKPTYIIMYEPNASFIRRVEAYRSSHPDRNLRVYFMYYKHSVEEQRYLSVVRKEKDAFTRLIKERGDTSTQSALQSMALSMNQNTNHPTASEAFLRSLNTRIAGGGLTSSALSLSTQPAPRQIIVDVREFRSSLPSLIHARAIQIVPAMLTVGDYILSPNLCVERKSVRDLISSLNNGRIYNQAESMLRHYRYAILLIEFDRDKAFTLEMFADLSLGSGAGSGAVNVAAHTRSGMAPPTAASAATSGSTPAGGKKGGVNMSEADLQTKLVMLTLAFPGLRIVWASSPNQAAELFDEMKRPEKEPDAAKAVEIGTEEVGEEGLAKDGSGGGAGVGRSMFAPVPAEMLMAIPGVGFSTAKKIQMSVSNIVELVNMTEVQLEKIVGAETSRQMSRFFERRVIDG